ncbi:MAG: hypothetical protein IIZ06_05465 [Kiritimatiellae bacterium]|nr:hypothetical protein [Kiritimatiellia bacterium]
MPDDVPEKRQGVAIAAADNVVGRAALEVPRGVFEQRGLGIEAANVKKPLPAHGVAAHRRLSTSGGRLFGLFWRLVCIKQCHFSPLSPQIITIKA